MVPAVIYFQQVYDVIQAKAKGEGEVCAWGLVLDRVYR